MVAPISSEALCHRLESGLNRWAEFWREVPFQQVRLSWLDKRPDLAVWLDGLSDAQVDAFDAAPETLVHQLAPWLPGLAAWLDGVRLPVLTAELPALPSFFEVDVPGRKWQQIQHFGAALPSVGTHLVDWCSGKGHLSRVAAHLTQLPVVSLERDAALCRDGQAMADRWQLPIRFQVSDVLRDPSPLQRDSHAIALHACGELHRRLLEYAVAAEVAAVTLSPCCYHLLASEHYVPLSQGLSLTLCRDELRLAVQETVTASASVRRQREHAQIYRLGFDALQRQVRGCDDYLPMPPVALSLFQQDFSTFGQQFAAMSGLALPDDWNAEHWFAIGKRRLYAVRRAELVRHLFRRPLELWLLMDRVRFLEQAGYDVEAGEFCPRPLTPRNLLIRATRSKR